MKRYLVKTMIAIALIVMGFLVYQYVVVKPQAKKVETIQVKKGDLREIMTISGKIEASEHVVLRFQTSGLLTWVGVKEGDYVKKYQGVAALDQRELQKNLTKYLETFKKEYNDFQDAKYTYDRSGIVMTDTIRRILENSQSDLNTSVLDVEIKDLVLKFANLWTPIDGVVIRAESPVAGVNITPTQAEFEIVNPKTVYFSALADQTEVTKLAAGQSGILVLDAFPDKEIAGQITTIAFTPDTSETGTVYPIKFSLPVDNFGQQYRLGMTGDLSFMTKESKDTIFIPSKFVKSDAGKKYVNKVVAEKTVKTFVQTGMETDTDIEILSGLAERETISL